MPRSGMKHQPPPGLLHRLRDYQEKLERQLKIVGVLSAPKALHADPTYAPDTLMLRTLQRTAEDRRPSADDFAAAQRHDGAPTRPTHDLPIPQKDILDDLANRNKSYLLLARVGTGKSVMLESFARELNAKTKMKLRADSLPDDLRIPLLVRLRDFNGLNEKEVGIRRLLEKAEGKLFTGDASTAILLPQDIKFLAEAGQLVPLFDGFDEFAHRGTFCEQLHHALSDPDLLKECKFAITSRPDADVGQIPVDRNNRRTLQPLTDVEIREYVTVKRQLSLEKLRHAPVAIRRLLPQPLYLCIWCNCVTRSQSPATAGELMYELFVDYLERRGIVRRPKDVDNDGEAQEERENEIASLRSLYARVCTQLAKVGFGTWMPLSKLTGVNPGDRRRLRGLIRRSGIIQCVPKATGDDLIYVNQVPVVEYLIGWHLAEGFRANASAESRSASLDIFRKWIWQPILHDVLDHCFDELWNSGNPQQEQTARDLSQWLVDISNQEFFAKDSTETIDTTTVHCCDDLLRPFCVTTLRFINLNHALDSKSPFQNYDPCRLSLVATKQHAARS
jgi:hypothetical protein